MDTNITQFHKSFTNYKKNVNYRAFLLKKIENCIKKSNINSTENCHIYLEELYNCKKNEN